MTDDEFAAVLQTYFGLTSVEPDSRIATDLRFDSLMWLECLELLEETAGHPIDLDALGPDPAVREIHAFLQQFDSSDR